MSNSATPAPSRDDLRRLAGDRAFARGEEYLEQGHVERLERHEDGVRADVYGSDVYRAWVGVKDGATRSSCNCPVGAEGKTCKHCVAVGLAWIAGAWDVPSVKDHADALAKYVRSMSQDVTRGATRGLVARGAPQGARCTSCARTRRVSAAARRSLRRASRRRRRGPSERAARHLALVRARRRLRVL